MFPTKINMTTDNAPQSTPNAPQSDPCADKGDGLERNTEAVDAVTGHRDTPEEKKVLRPLLAYYQGNRNHEKTNDPITHMKGV